MSPDEILKNTSPEYFKQRNESTLDEGYGGIESTPKMSHFEIEEPAGKNAV